MSVTSTITFNLSYSILYIFYDSISVALVESKQKDSRWVSVASCTTPSEEDTDAMSINATEASNIYDLKDVVLEINQINLSDNSQTHQALY